MKRKDFNADVQILRLNVVHVIMGSKIQQYGSLARCRVRTHTPITYYIQHPPQSLFLLLLLLLLGGVELKATFCLSPGIRDPGTGVGTREMSGLLGHGCAMTLHYIKTPSFVCYPSRHMLAVPRCLGTQPSVFRLPVSHTPLVIHIPCTSSCQLLAYHCSHIPLPPPILASDSSTCHAHIFPLPPHFLH
jgi:hypothetical protein